MLRLMKLSLTVFLSLTFAAACSKKTAPETQPAPAPDSAAVRARQDSIDAANRARAEAEARAKADSARAAAAREQSALAAALAEKVHFEFNKSDIQPGDAAILDRKAAIMAANPGVRILIAGNADDRGSDEYNLALGNRRALAAQRYLVSKGVDGSRIETISYGEERPIDPAQNEQAWAANRRDDFTVTAGGTNLVAPR